jgi:5-methylcytosine-specific restriction protein B
MNENELIEKLKAMYEGADKGFQVANIHLFGIQHANSLKNKNLKYIASKATGNASYSSEISKGIKLKPLLGNVCTVKDNNPYNLNNDDFNIKNIILYGAPGVGKTHNTNKLISLIEQGKSQSEIFHAIKENINEKVILDDDTKARTKFITFHQSYSYEDFIEGFRPQENGNIELEDGIFKSISIYAMNNFKNSFKTSKTIEDEINLRNQFEAYINYKIESNEAIKLQRGESFYLSNFQNGLLYFEASKNSNVNKTFTFKFNDLFLIYNSDLPKSTLIDISHILGTNYVQQKYAYYLQIYLDFKQYVPQQKKINTASISNQQKNYYLIIDEINRGNISKIFGELITLIEEDKRDKIEVTLPYSKESFKVPPNLFIIGTMNSTDKSIALIDIALRRRFTFLKMKPNIDLVPQVAQNYFNAINKFITENKSEEYQLGHSYFMRVENEEDLAFVKEYKVKPLLEEYFYADDENLKKALET